MTGMIAFLAGLVIALVMFMLLERRDLRDRLIGLFGQGHLAVTTKAFDEAGTRVSRQLLMQSLASLVYGVVDFSVDGVEMSVEHRPHRTARRRGLVCHPLRRTGMGVTQASPLEP